jgi:hypothetical protein
MAILVVILLMPETMEAQCPMCKIAAESNLNNGGSAGKGLNNGIFYMLSMPYIIVGTIAFLWWKNNKKKAQAEV